MEPPTGMPRKLPAITFAAPWPMKSRDASGQLPSGLGNAAEMAAPWIRSMNASDSAGTSSDGTSRSTGATGSGSEREWRRARRRGRRYPSRAARRRPR